MVEKFVIEVEEMTADYEDDKLIGYTTSSHRLLFFDNKEEADDAIVSIAESQDCDSKADVKTIGWVEVPDGFRQNYGRMEAAAIH